MELVIRIEDETGIVMEKRTSVSDVETFHRILAKKIKQIADEAGLTVKVEKYDGDSVYRVYVIKTEVGKTTFFLR